MLREAQNITTAELIRAARFYNRSPDGEYDEIALSCILRILLNRADAGDKEARAYFGM